MLFAAVVVFSMLPVAVFDALNTAAILKERGQEREFQVARRTADHIDDYLDDLASWGRDFSHRPAIRTWLEAGDYADPALRARWEREILASFRRRERLTGTFVATPAGAVVLRDGRTPFPAPLADWPLFRHAAAGHGTISDVYATPGEAARHLALLVPITNPAHGRVVAVVGMVAPLDHLRSLVAQDAGAVGDGSFAILADERFAPLVHGLAPQLEGAPYPDPGPARTIASLRADPAASPFTYHTLPTLGERGYGAMALLKSKPWVYYVVAPESYFLAPIWRQLAQNAVVLLAMLLLAVGLSIALARWFGRPIARLHAAAAAWERGDLATRTGMTGENELAGLGRAFDRMAAELQGHAQALERQIQARTAELSQANAALRASYAQLQALDRLKDDFVNAVSHDLRTPLTSIMGYAEFLEDEFGGPLSPGQAEYVRQIQLASHRLEGLVNDLLDFARLEAGTFQLKLEPAELGPKVREIAESLRPQVEAAHLALELELPDWPVRLPMDAQRIGQVLTNLIHNATKFTPAGGHIRVALRLEGDHVVCEIRDTGIGIAPEDVPKLFQRFSQLSGGKEKGGTGLGLNISKAIIEAHGGAIGVRSAPNQGSTFWFSLPLGLARAAA